MPRSVSNQLSLFDIMQWNRITPISIFRGTKLYMVKESKNCPSFQKMTMFDKGHCYSIDKIPTSDYFILVRLANNKDVIKIYFSDRI